MERRPATPIFSGAGESVDECGVGSSGVLECCERAPWVVSKAEGAGGADVDVAELDVGKAP
jgi:hypothetical protein